MLIEPEKEDTEDDLGGYNESEEDENYNKGREVRFFLGYAGAPFSGYHLPDVLFVEMLKSRGSSRLKPGWICWKVPGGSS